MVEYTVDAKKYDGTTVSMTVIATSITHALDLVDLYIEDTYGKLEDWEVESCTFVKRIKTCLIEKPGNFDYL